MFPNEIEAEEKKRLQLEALVTVLAEMGLCVPADVTPKTLIPALLTAVKTSIATKAKIKQEQQRRNNDGTNPDLEQFEARGGPQQFSTMSDDSGRVWNMTPKQAQAVIAKIDKVLGRK